MGNGSRTVLVADDGDLMGRSALSAVRALGLAGHRPVVTVAGHATLASSSRWCAGTVTVPGGDAAGWLRAVEAATIEADVSLTLPSSDGAVVSLGLPGAALVDKRNVRAKAAAAGLRVPEEQVFDDRMALEHADGLPYPIVVKPAVRLGPSAPNAVRVDGPGGIERIVTGQPLVVQPFLTGAMHACGGLVIGGRLVAAVHQRYERIWPPECGVSSAAVTIDPDAELEERILELVRGHEGIVQVQLVDGHVIDVNPRAYGSLPLAVRAGVNLPALWCSMLDRDSAPSNPVRARVGVHYRWLDADLRAVWRLVRSGSMPLPAAFRALAPRGDTAHSVEDWRDPKPSFVRMAGWARGSR